MIIKFREERIAELETKLSNAESISQGDTSATSTGDSEVLDSLRKQLADAQKEIS